MWFKYNKTTQLLLLYHQYAHLPIKNATFAFFIKQEYR